MDAGHSVWVQLLANVAARNSRVAAQVHQPVQQVPLPDDGRLSDGRPGGGNRAETGQEDERSEVFQGGGRGVADFLPDLPGEALHQRFDGRVEYAEAGHSCPDGLHRQSGVKLAQPYALPVADPDGVAGVAHDRPENGRPVVSAGQQRHGQRAPAVGRGLATGRRPVEGEVPDGPVGDDRAQSVGGEPVDDAVVGHHVHGVAEVPGQNREGRYRGVPHDADLGQYLVAHVDQVLLPDHAGADRGGEVGSGGVGDVDEGVGESVAGRGAEVHDGQRETLQPSAHLVVGDLQHRRRRLGRAARGWTAELRHRGGGGLLPRDRSHCPQFLDDVAHGRPARRGGNVHRFARRCGRVVVGLRLRYPRADETGQGQISAGAALPVLGWAGRRDWIRQTLQDLAGGVAERRSGQRGDLVAQSQELVVQRHGPDLLDEELRVHLCSPGAR